MLHDSFSARPDSAAGRTPVATAGCQSQRPVHRIIFERPLCAAGTCASGLRRWSPTTTPTQQARNSPHTTARGVRHDPRCLPCYPFLFVPMQSLEPSPAQTQPPPPPRSPATTTSLRRRIVRRCAASGLPPSLRFLSFGRSSSACRTILHSRSPAAPHSASVVARPRGRHALHSPTQLTSSRSDCGQVLFPLLLSASTAPTCWACHSCRPCGLL